MQEKLINLIANELNIPKENIHLESDIHDDLGADSLDAVELIMSIEDTFDITIPESEASRIKTVKDLLGFIENQ